ncbi:MAG: hypothetical protein ACYC8T_29670 [Myxococcaceae bacterium]
MTRPALAVLSLAVALAATALAQGPTRPGSPPPGPPPRRMMGPPDGGMPAYCQMMMSGGMSPEIRTQLTEMNNRLDQKVAAMNQAKGNARVDAMASALNELVAQRKQLQDLMAAHRQQMMTHMMSMMGRQPSECPMGPQGQPAQGPVK